MGKCCVKVNNKDTRIIAMELGQWYLMLALKYLPTININFREAPAVIHEFLYPIYQHQNLLGTKCDSAFHKLLSRPDQSEIFTKDKVFIEIQITKCLCSLIQYITRKGILTPLSNLF